MISKSSTVIAAAILALLLPTRVDAQVLLECLIDFEVTCPDAIPSCGSTFSGGNSCAFEGLFFCYSSGLFSYKITPAAPLTVTFSGDVRRIDMFFVHQGAAASGTATFFDAIVGGNPVGAPLPTNGDCLPGMPPNQTVSFSSNVRRMEVTAVGGPLDAVWIDDFRVNHCLADCAEPIDGEVSVIDLLKVLGEWGTPGTHCDLDGNGTIDVIDLLEVLAKWGTCSP